MFVLSTAIGGLSGCLFPSPNLFFFLLLEYVNAIKYLESNSFGAAMFFILNCQNESIHFVRYVKCIGFQTLAEIVEFKKSKKFIS